ncbi:hypothetical protein [Marinovum sp.]
MSFNDFAKKEAAAKEASKTKPQTSTAAPAKPRPAAAAKPGSSGD